ncbi:uncharacterized protein LOC128962265 [Oppia nitens]|uniref:uncharacterized protein LOC128962265 n=1 Tax=Oppia nitens TaxID=1686743 RepID=UPI0023DCB3F5|nr:uncharacterized protein LOC128962265 [Oppia nitens]
MSVSLDDLLFLSGLDIEYGSNRELAINRAAAAAVATNSYDDHSLIATTATTTTDNIAATVASDDDDDHCLIADNTADNIAADTSDDHSFMANDNTVAAAAGAADSTDDHIVMANTTDSTTSDDRSLMTTYSTTAVAAVSSDDHSLSADTDNNAAIDANNNNTADGHGDDVDDDSTASYSDQQQQQRNDNQLSMSEIINYLAEPPSTQPPTAIVNHSTTTPTVRYMSPDWHRQVQRQMSELKVLVLGEPHTIGGGGSGGGIGHHKLTVCSDICHRRLDGNLSQLMDRQKDGGGGGGGGRRLMFRSFAPFSPIIRMTTAVESLVFSNCSVDTIALKWLITQCPRLQCLTFDNIDGIPELHWHKLGKPLANKLLHFCYSGNRMNSWKALQKMVKYFDILDELTIHDYGQSLDSPLSSVSSTVTRLTISKCQQLDIRCLKSVRRSVRLRQLTLDLCGHQSDDIVQFVYQRFTCLVEFRVRNGRKMGIRLYLHRLDLNELTIQYDEDLNLNFLSTTISPRIHSLILVSAIIVPSLVKHIGELRNCRLLMLKDCWFNCECKTTGSAATAASTKSSTKTTTDTPTPPTAGDYEPDLRYKCIQCFKRTIRCIVRMPALVRLAINGYDFPELTAKQLELL